MTRKAFVPTLTEGMVRKGGHNVGPSAVKTRPPAPAPMRSGVSSPVNTGDKALQPGIAEVYQEAALSLHRELDSPDLFKSLNQIPTTVGYSLGSELFQGQFGSLSKKTA